MAVITNTEVKAYLNITNSTNDTQLTAYCDRVQKQCEQYCNQHFDSTSHDYYFTGLGSEYYVMPFRTITAVNSIYYRIRPTDTWVALSAINYALYEDGKINKLYNYGSFLYGYHYKVNITSGYSYLNMPTDLKQILIEMVSTIYAESKLSGDSRLAVDQVVTSFAGEITNKRYLDLWQTRWKELLKPYRVPTV